MGWIGFAGRAKPMARRCSCLRIFGSFDVCQLVCSLLHRSYVSRIVSGWSCLGHFSSHLIRSFLVEYRGLPKGQERREGNESGLRILRRFAAFASFFLSQRFWRVVFIGGSCSFLRNGTNLTKIGPSKNSWHVNFLVEITRVSPPHRLPGPLNVSFLRFRPCSSNYGNRVRAARENVT